MSDATIFLAIFLVSSLLYFIIDRNDIINRQWMEDMKVDHLQCCNDMRYMTRNQCERVIDQFYGRWSGKVDEWELSNRTASLYKRLFELQKERDMMEKRRDNHNQ